MAGFQERPALTADLASVRRARSEPTHWKSTLVPPDVKGEAGSPVTVVSGRRPPAGPALIQVTMDRYGHLFPDALEHLANRLDAARTQARTNPERIKRRDGLIELSTRPVQTGRRGDFMGRSWNGAKAAQGIER